LEENTMLSIEGAVRLARPRRILVTGAAGFIGSHVVEALLERGDIVVGLDNFDPFYAPEIKWSNLELARSLPGYAFVEGDIRDSSALDQAFAIGQLDAVVHLAARAGVRPSIVDPLLYDSVNVVGTTTLLERSRLEGVPNFIFGSSSSVYGSTTKVPFSEEEVAAMPSSPYAATKRASELSCYAYHHLYGMNVACLRFFTVYGPRQRPEMAIHKFTDLIASGQPVPMFGDGSSRRDYTYVSDIVHGVIAALDRCHGYRIYNLGTTATTSLRDLLTMIGTKLNRPVEIDQLPNQPGDVPITYADVTRAAQELDYAPRTSISDGLDRFISWYSEARMNQLTWRALA
jgi:UDP-glucuronate 4-epimerase